MKSLRKLRSELRKSAAYAQTLSKEALERVSLAAGADSQVRERAFCEVLLRIWLYSDSFTDPYEQILKKLVEKGQLEANFVKKFVNWAKREREFTLPDELFYEFRDSRLTFRLKKRLDAWKNADGAVLIVVNGENGQKHAFATPFRLENAEKTVCENAKGEKLVDFQPIVEQNAANYRVIFPLLDPKTGKIHPESAALPIFLAVHAKKNYLGISCFDFMATGAIENNQLTVVTGIAEKAEIAQKIGCRAFAYPKNAKNSAKIAKDDEFEALSLKNGPIDGAIEEILAFLQAKNLVLLQDESALDSAVKSLHLAARFSRLSSKQVLERSLVLEEKLSEAELINTDLLNQTRLIRAAVLCHLGKSQESNQLIQQSIQDLERLPRIKTASHAIAQQVTALTDLWDFAEAERIGLAQLAHLENLKQSHSTLTQTRQYWQSLMELNGALGQNGTSWALHCGQQDHKDNAKRYLDDACAAAKKLSGGQLSKDWIQDQTYIAMWHCCFSDAPTALKFITRLETEIQRSRSFGIEHNYLRRIKLLAHYRHYLKTGNVPAKKITDITKCPDANAPDWLHITTFRYQGALLAAQDHPAQAIDLFERGLTFVTAETAPLIRFFGFILCYQAHHSLQSVSKSDAHKFLLRARKQFDICKQSLPEAMLEPWKSWTENLNNLELMLRLIY